jgi:predicted nucleic acid-binding protein
VYVDANAVIYFVEQIEPFRNASLPLWVALNAGQVQVVTSELTLLEVLVKPARAGNRHLESLYRGVVLGTPGLTHAPIERQTLERAVQVRANHNLKTPDAIHAATALQTGCVMFVTNDPTFRRVNGLNVVILADVAAS